MHPELAAGVGHGDVTHGLLHHARPGARPRDGRQEAEAVIVTRADVVNRLRPRSWRRLVIIRVHRRRRHTDTATVPVSP